MVTISLCMIVRDEEDVIGRCLESVADLVDEVIVVDTGSTDRTKEIVAGYTPHILDFPWVDDFAAARNFSFQQGHSQYCMWLDADDMLLEEDRAEFAAQKARLDPAVDVVMMPYHTGFDADGSVTFSYQRERILKNHGGFVWQGAVHEVITPAGRVEHWPCAVTHRKLHPSDPHRNLRIFERLLENGVTLDPRQQYYYGRELYYHRRYQDAIRVLEGFLDGGMGWLENQIDACRHCAYCHYGMGREEEALGALLRSFCFDLPRAEVCCELGRHFFDRARYPQAAYWYERALSCARPDDRGGFTTPDAYGYTPCIQLCVCHSRMGEQGKAAHYNELAAGYRPDAEAVAHNRAYFAGLSTEWE